MLVRNPLNSTFLVHFSSVSFSKSSSDSFKMLMGYVLFYSELIFVSTFGPNIAISKVCRFFNRRRKTRKSFSVLKYIAFSPRAACIE